jgi:hypothetical protein
MAGYRRRRAPPPSLDDLIKSWPLVLLILALIANALVY